jgi:hypothetical protein
VKLETESIFLTHAAGARKIGPDRQPAQKTFTFFPIDQKVANEDGFYGLGIFFITGSEGEGA